LAYDFIDNDCAGKVLDESCSVGCAVGFERVGGAEPSMLTCLHDSQYSVTLQGDVPQCVPKVCNASDLDDEFEHNCTGRQFGDDACTVLCVGEATGEPTELTCASTGRLSGLLPSCTSPTPQVPEIRIRGTVTLSVTDLVGFMRDTAARQVLRKGIAKIAGVRKEYVFLALSLLGSNGESDGNETNTTEERRLDEMMDDASAVERQLAGGNLLVEYEIRIPVSDTEAVDRARAGSMQASLSDTTAVAVLDAELQADPTTAGYGIVVEEFGEITISEATPTSTVSPLAAEEEEEDGDPALAGALGTTAGVLSAGMLAGGFLWFRHRRNARQSEVQVFRPDREELA